MDEGYEMNPCARRKCQVPDVDLFPSIDQTHTETIAVENPSAKWASAQ